jgi:hypothetical protein
MYQEVIRIARGSVIPGWIQVGTEGFGAGGNGICDYHNVLVCF